MVQLQACLLRFCQGLGLLGLRHDRRGVTALEYGMIAALIAVVVATAVGNVGTKLTSTFVVIASKV